MKRKWILIAGGALLLAVIVGASLRGRGGRDAVRVYAEPVVKRERAPLHHDKPHASCSR